MEGSEGEKKRRREEGVLVEGHVGKQCNKELLAKHKEPMFSLHIPPGGVCFATQWIRTTDKMVDKLNKNPHIWKLSAVNSSFKLLSKWQHGSNHQPKGHPPMIPINWGSLPSSLCYPQFVQRTSTIWGLQFAQLLVAAQRLIFHWICG